MFLPVVLALDLQIAVKNSSHRIYNTGGTPLQCYPYHQCKVCHFGTTTDYLYGISDAKTAVTITVSSSDDPELFYFVKTMQQANEEARQRLLAYAELIEGKHPKYNHETEEAMSEARDISSGKKKAKSYSNAKELFEELNKSDE